jgi:hypothetical protein
MFAGQVIDPTNFISPPFRTRILPYSLFIGKNGGNFSFFSFFSFKFLK